jgi:hypothetical protein
MRASGVEVIEEVIEGLAERSADAPEGPAHAPERPADMPTSDDLDATRPNAGH